MTLSEKRKNTIQQKKYEQSKSLELRLICISHITPLILRNLFPYQPKIYSNSNVIIFNLQNLLKELMYRNVHQSSESQSEASSSAESELSDINSIAKQLNLDPKDICVQRFKVDRQKLENMIKSKYNDFHVYVFTLNVEIS